MYESSCCSIPSPAFGVVNVLDIDHFNRCVVVSLFFLLQYSCFFKYNFIYLFIFGSAGCSLLHGLCSSCGERRCSPAVVCRLWDRLSCWGARAVRASVIVAPGLRSTGSIVVTHGLSCSHLLGPGLTPRLLHWQADSLPLSHQGSPHYCFGLDCPHDVWCGASSHLFTSYLYFLRWDVH